MWCLENFRDPQNAAHFLNSLVTIRFIKIDSTLEWVIELSGDWH